jgi:uncharacterized protein DUF2188
MAPRNPRTVGPKKGGNWQVSGGTKSHETKTQEAGVKIARGELLGSGGGELIIKGRDGKIRDTRTIGRKDPRESRG